MDELSTQLLIDFFTKFFSVHQSEGKLCFQCNTIEKIQQVEWISLRDQQKAKSAQYIELVMIIKVWDHSATDLFYLK